MQDSSARHGLDPPFLHRGGLAWAAYLPVDWPSDSSQDPACSRLQLWEDDIALGARHALHGAIESEGRGRYSHWDGRRLIFSTSDGSDPNTNGRRYTVSIGEPTFKVLGLGSCHLFEALVSLEERGLAHGLWRPPLLVYTPREALQLIGFYGGEQDIPAWLHPLTVADTIGAVPLTGGLRGADIAFLEFGSTIDIAYGPYFLTRSQVYKYVLQPFSALSEEIHEIGARWHNQGLMKRDEVARAETVEQLIALLPRTGLDPEPAADILRNARGSEQDAASAADTIRQIGERLQAHAMCVLSTQNAFTPDGRPLSWPGNFLKSVETICRLAGLPLLHTSKLVAEKGAAFALKDNLVHFTPQMTALLGDEVLIMGKRALRAREDGVIASAGNEGVAPAMQS